MADSRLRSSPMWQVPSLQGEALDRPSGRHKSNGSVLSKTNFEQTAGPACRAGPEYPRITPLQSTISHPADGLHFLTGLLVRLFGLQLKLPTSRLPIEK